MLIITLQRDKCIGCNYCVNLNPIYFRISKKDGKSILLNSLKKKNFFIFKTFNNYEYKNTLKAAKVCPIKIINVKKI